MVYEEFLTAVKQDMELAGSGYTLSLRKVQKNNGLVWHVVYALQKNRSCVPFYLSQSIIISNTEKGIFHSQPGERAFRALTIN